MRTGETIEFLVYYTNGSSMTTTGTIESTLKQLDPKKCLMKVRVRCISAYDDPIGHGFADISDARNSRQMLACAVDRARRNRSANMAPRPSRR